MSNVLTIDDAERARLKATHAAVLHKPWWQRSGLLIGLVVTVLYLGFCYAFFNVGPAFENGKWDRAALECQLGETKRVRPV